MANGAWYYQVADKAVGPVSSAQLRQLAASGHVTPATYIRRGTDGDWTTADHVRGLFSDAPLEQPHTMPPSREKTPTPAPVDEQPQPLRPAKARQTVPELPERSYKFLRTFTVIYRGIGLFVLAIAILLLLLVREDDRKVNPFIMTGAALTMIVTAELIRVVIDIAENTRHSCDLLKAYMQNDADDSNG